MGIVSKNWRNIQGLLRCALVCLCWVAIPGSTSGQDAMPFNVGVIIPLTGDLADYGSSIQRGVELAISQSPERFSNIHFLYEDSRYDGSVAVTAFQKLKAANSPDMYYAWGVSPTEAIIPIAEAAKLPLLVETTLKESTTKKAYIVRAARTGERIAQALAGELARRKLRSVAILNTDIPFYNDILRHLETLLPAQKITISRIERILPTENDLRSYALKLKKEPADAVGLFLLPGQFGSFYRNADQLKFPVRAFSADIIGAESIVRSCPDNINGTFFTEVGVTPGFLQLYSGRFGADGHIGHAAQAYDVANLISDLFGHLKTRISGAEVLDRIAQIPPQKGATGELRYSDTVEGGKEIQVPVAMKEIRNKKIETISEDVGV